MKVIALLLQIFAFLVLAPFVQGFIKKIKAALQLRKGPPLLQMYADLKKWWLKESIVSERASWIFLAAPYFVFMTILAIMLLVPAFNGNAVLPDWADFIVVLYLFALMHFFLALAGLDAGSAFGGMGSSREMLISSLIEPAFFASLTGLALRTHTANLSAMSAGLAKFGWDVFSPSHLLALAAAIIILVTETGRIPVDNPDTHLELTMIHEGMILEYSGRELALMHYAAALKQLILLSILANLFLPFGVSLTGLGGIFAGTVVFLIKIFFLAALLAIIETAFVKLRIFRAPDLLIMAFLLTMLSIVSQYYL